jgi:hypothetical protein
VGSRPKSTFQFFSSGDSVTPTKTPASRLVAAEHFDTAGDLLEITVEDRLVT